MPIRPYPHILIRSVLDYAERGPAPEGNAGMQLILAVRDVPVSSGHTHDALVVAVLVHHPLHLLTVLDPQSYPVYPPLDVLLAGDAPLVHYLRSGIQHDCTLAIL